MSEEDTENITKSGSNFGTTFANHHVLLDINFNGNCLLNNIYIPNKYIYFLHTKSMVQKFQHKLYIN